jgi:sugar phosphate isomerase/epimerase
MRVLMFTKYLNALSIEQVGETVRSLGFDGVDLTVRPLGHVLPEDAAHGLAPAVRALRRASLEVPMITTAITSAGDPHAESIAGAAAESGVRFIKLGYWKYLGFGHLHAQIEDARRELAGLEALARRHGVRFCIHTHSGSSLSASAAVVRILLDGFDPEALGAYVDPGHMAVEGGLAGWRQELELLGDRISLVGVKNFAWYHDADPATGAARWHVKVVPLAHGVAPWPEVLANLRQLGYDGYYSVHSEYAGRESWQVLDHAGLLEQTRRDLAYLRGLQEGSAS